jgi:hypothetical protein
MRIQPPPHIRKNKLKEQKAKKKIKIKKGPTMEGVL